MHSTYTNLSPGEVLSHQWCCGGAQGSSAQWDQKFVEDCQSNTNTGDELSSVSILNNDGTIRGLKKALPAFLVAKMQVCVQITPPWRMEATVWLAPFGWVPVYSNCSFASTIMVISSRKSLFTSLYTNSQQNQFLELSLLQYNQSDRHCYCPRFHEARAGKTTYKIVSSMKNQKRQKGWFSKIRTNLEMLKY